MLPVFEANGHLKLARVIFPRVIRGSELDPEFSCRFLLIN